MTIKEMIARVNKSKQFEDTVFIGGFAEAIGIYNIYNYNDPESRLISYYIGNWYCTDTYVGYKVYFFDDVPVAVSSQTGRKMDEKIEWLSKEDFKKVKDYILTFLVEEESTIALANMDEDIGESYKIDYCAQMFPYHKEIPLFKGEKVKIIEEEKSGSQIEKKVKIKMHDSSEKWVEIRELDFPYNLTK